MRPVICAFADSREQRAKGEDGSRKAIADDGNRGGAGEGEGGGSRGAVVCRRSDLYGPHLNVPKYSDLSCRPSNTPASARPDSQAISRRILFLSSPFH